MSRSFATRALGTLVAALSLMHGSPVDAADHNDSPTAKDDPAADIADLWAFHTPEGRLVLILSFAGLAESGTPATYDPDVLYGFHVDRDGDNTSDHDIWVRFGQNGAGQWGMQVQGLPGDDAALVGSVETNLANAGGNKAYAGLREDPFFFDLEGFLMTKDTGTLSFDSSRDTFAGTNVTAIVVETDTDMVADGADNLSIWATAARKG